MKTPFYLEAPNHLERYDRAEMTRTVFLAGSITGASDWQSDAAAKLAGRMNVFNPRRKDFDVKDKTQERVQIAWEYKHLDLAEITLFYFAPETLAPITLFEYGKMREKARTEYFRRIYVCVHPEYKRRNDVFIQTELIDPRLMGDFYDTLDGALAAIVRDRDRKDEFKKFYNGAERL